MVSTAIRVQKQQYIQVNNSTNGYKNKGDAWSNSVFVDSILKSIIKYNENGLNIQPLNLYCEIKLFLWLPQL